jgi:hypothetical protein
MTRLLAGSAIVFAIAALCLLAGCAGPPPPPAPPPPGDTAKVTGSVVRADNVNAGIRGAQVEARSLTGEVLVATTADGAGQFTLDDIPVGDIVISADAPAEPDYGSQTVPGIHLNPNDELEITITILRLDQAAPTTISLTPQQATVDVRGHVDFNAAVSSSGGVLEALPTYLLSTAIGVVDRTGNFTATQVGTGQLRAVCGTASATASIQVTPARPPAFTTYFVAPQTLRSTGGNVTITAAVNDGDGISLVRAEIYRPDTSVVFAVMPVDPGTAETYRVIYPVPPNSNPPDPSGHQASQRYSIRVVAFDNASQSSATSFVDVVVEGVDAPPPPI